MRFPSFGLEKSNMGSLARVRQYHRTARFTSLFEPVDQQTGIEKELFLTVFGLAGRSGETAQWVLIQFEHLRNSDGQTASATHSAVP